MTFVFLACIDFGLLLVGSRPTGRVETFHRAVDHLRKALLELLFIHNLAVRHRLAQLKRCRHKRYGGVFLFPSRTVSKQPLHVVELDVRGRRTRAHIKPMRRSSCRNHPVRIHVCNRDMVRRSSNPHAVSIEVSQLEMFNRQPRLTVDVDNLSIRHQHRRHAAVISSWVRGGRRVHVQDVARKIELIRRHQRRLPRRKLRTPDAPHRPVAPEVSKKYVVERTRSDRSLPAGRWIRGISGRLRSLRVRSTTYFLDTSGATGRWGASGVRSLRRGSRRWWHLISSIFRATSCTCTRLPPQTQLLITAAWRRC